MKSFFAPANLVIKCFILLLSWEFVVGYAYPYFGGSRYFPMVSPRRSAYVPIPINSRRSSYAIPDYDDGYISPDQDDYDYNPYQKYNPYIRYAGPSVVPYYLGRDYYLDKTPRKNWDRYGYYEDPAPQDSVDEEPEGQYPNGEEPLYDDSRYDSNAEANEAFLRNLMLAQMYQDAKYPPPTYRYDTPTEDYDDRKYDYGVPTTKVEEKEKVRRYFREKENNEVRELEALARKRGKNRKMKEKETYEKPKKMTQGEKPTKPKSRMSDAEYFDLQKQIIVNSRKNNYAPVAEGLRVEKKQIYTPLSDTSKFWNYEPYLSESTTNSIKKLNAMKAEDKTEELTSPSTTIAPSTKAPRNIAKVGQKEVVLPRPSNPVRRPYPEISTRSLHPPSVYDTIKKLLDMEKEEENKLKSQPQKRFVMTDDPLSAELNGLKKPSA